MSNEFFVKFVLSTTSKQIEHVQLVSTLSKGRNLTINSFDGTVGAAAVLLSARRTHGERIKRDEHRRLSPDHTSNKVERCFDIVAGVNGV